MKTRLIILTTLMAVAMTAVGQNRYLDNIKKAEAGDAEAQVKVGIAYGNGEGLADVHSPIMIGYNPKWENEENYPYDVAKAKQLVAESDYKGQTLSILCSGNGDMPRMAQVLQAFMMQAGINVEINAAEMAYIVANRLDGTKYDMFINTIGGTYLADAWAIRYDPNAYSTGDGTSRKDYVLGELLYETWTPDGWTEENIDKVHNYLKESCIAYGLFNPYNFCVWSNEIGLTDEVYSISQHIAPLSSTYTGL